VVTANTRLGLLGYAALEGLRSRDPSGSTGNYGVQDQRAVLRWVKQSIASFGGNASKITLFGESSGGSSVAFHLTSKLSQGLFSQVIMESPGLTQSKSWADSVRNTQYAVSALTAAGSGACTWSWEAEWMDFPGLAAQGHPLAVVSRTEGLSTCQRRPDCFLVYNPSASSNVSLLFGGGTPGHLGDSVVNLFNSTAQHGKDPGMETLIRVPNEATAVTCLMKANISDLIALDQMPPHDDTFRTDAVAPTVDGVELSAPLDVLSVTAVPADVPVLAGSNMDEGTEFMYLVPRIDCNASEAEFASWAVNMFGPELGAKVPPLYNVVEQPAPLCHSTGENTSNFWQAAMRSAGDSAILCRTRELLRASQGRGNNKTWWYYFTHTPNRSVNMGDLKYYGAFHGAEVPFVWGDSFELTGEKEVALSRAMGCYWINFAATGNPNEGPSGCSTAQSLPNWPVLGSGDALEFAASGLRTRPSLKRDQCDMFAANRHPDHATEVLLI